MASIVVMIGCCVVQVALAGEYPIIFASGETQRIGRTLFQQVADTDVSERWTPFQFGIWPEAPNIQLFPCEWNVYGLGIGLSTLNSHVYGIQICGACIAADAMEGMQLGIFSATGAMQGIQIGGIVNYSTNMTGLQVGSINFSETMTGLQIGLMNICSHHIVGVQIGILNYIENSPVHVLPLINARF